MAELRHINSQEFNDLINNSEKPVLVDFFATWCGPCKMLGPVLEQVQDEITNVLIVKLDIDESMEIAQEYGIMSVPTMVLYYHGAELHRSVGFIQKNQVIEMLKSQLDDE